MKKVSGMDLLYKTLPNLSRYIIYSDGTIFDTKLNRFVKFHTNKDGYLKITISLDNGKRKTFSVHRLVAESFIENSFNKPTVNHIDGIKLNNNKSNLEWATRSEQTQHAWDNNLIKDLLKRKDGIRKLQGKPVICITTGEIFNSVGEAAEIKGLKKSNISAVCLNKVGFKTAGKTENGIKLEWRFYEL